MNELPLELIYCILERVTDEEFTYRSVCRNWNTIFLILKNSFLLGRRWKEGVYFFKFLPLRDLKEQIEQIDYLPYLIHLEKEGSLSWREIISYTRSYENLTYCLLSVIEPCLVGIRWGELCSEQDLPKETFLDNYRFREGFLQGLAYKGKRTLLHKWRNKLKLNSYWTLIPLLLGAISGNQYILLEELIVQLKMVNSPSFFIDLEAKLETITFISDEVVNLFKKTKLTSLTNLFQRFLEIENNERVSLEKINRGKHYLLHYAYRRGSLENIILLTEYLGYTRDSLTRGQGLFNLSFENRYDIIEDIQTEIEWRIVLIGALKGRHFSLAKRIIKFINDQEIKLSDFTKSQRVIYFMNQLNSHF